MTSEEPNAVPASVAHGVPWWRRMLRAIAMLRASEKAYLFGMLVLIVAFLGRTLPVTGDAVSKMGWIGAFALVVALASEAYRLIVRHADAAWAKWLMVPILVMGGALAVGEAANLVNRATSQDPELFPRTVAFMAPIAALPLLGLIAIALSFFGIIAFMFTWGSQLSSRDPRRERRAWFWFARMIAAFSAIVFVSPAVESDSRFHSSVRWLAATMAPGLDMHDDIRCAPEGDRVKRISDTLVLVAHRADVGTAFRRETCPITAD